MGSADLNKQSVIILFINWLGAINGMRINDNVITNWLWRVCVGLCNVESSSQRRMSELHRRNTLQPPHMRSAYPTEMNDERLRKTNINLVVVEEPETSTSEDHVQQLARATSQLSMHTPPAMNTRKRRSSLWNQADNDTPVVARKRRSFEADISLETEDSRLSISSNSAERKKRREPTLTSYKRPGPPTPARNSSLKENISTPSVFNFFIFHYQIHLTLT